MPGTESAKSKLKSGRLLLSFSIAMSVAGAASAKVDQQLEVLGGALAGSSQFASMPGLRDATKKHPEFSTWLPGYKLASLSASPYTLPDRVWEVLSGELAPVAAILALHTVSTWGGLHSQLVGMNDEKLADTIWRLSEGIGDFATSDSRSELLWRLFVSNMDLVRPPELSSAWQKNALWAAKRLLSFSPMLYQAVPDAMRQHLLNTIGYAPIAYETPELNEHFPLTYVSSSSADDLGRPADAYLDLRINHDTNPYTKDMARGRFEKALADLDASARDHNLTLIRFYPTVLGDYRKGGKLTLFVRPFYNNRPGPLIRFPASFGSSNDRLWWTDAMNRGVFHGVYNNDQYTLVSYINKAKGYDKSLITPLSDQILEMMPQLVRWAAKEPEANDYGFSFEEQMHTAVEPEGITADDSVNLGLPGIPKQSMYHTSINLGDEGHLFVDDSFSQRAELPLITLVSRARHSDIKTADLLKLEKHLPWQNYRGLAKIGSTAGRNFAYSMFVNQLMHARSKQLKEFRDSVKDIGDLPAGASYDDQVSLVKQKRALIGDKDIAEAIKAQETEVNTNHKKQKKNYETSRNKLTATIREENVAKKNLDQAKAQVEEARTSLEENKATLAKNASKLKDKQTPDYSELVNLHKNLREAEERTAKGDVRKSIARVSKNVPADVVSGIEKVSDAELKLSNARADVRAKNKELLSLNTKVNENKAAVGKALGEDKDVRKLVHLQRFQDARQDGITQELLSEIKEEGKALGLPQKAGLLEGAWDVVNNIKRAFIPEILSKRKPATATPTANKATPPQSANASGATEEATAKATESKTAKSKAAESKATVSKAGKLDTGKLDTGKLNAGKLKSAEQTQTEGANTPPAPVVTPVTTTPEGTPASEEASTHSKTESIGNSSEQEKPKKTRAKKAGTKKTTKTPAKKSGKEAKSKEDSKPLKNATPKTTTQNDATTATTSEDAKDDNKPVTKTKPRKKK